MKKVLYVGLTCPEHAVHCPLIKIVPRTFEELAEAYEELGEYSHVIFTSKSTVRIFFDYLAKLGKKITHQQLIAVGKATAREIEKYDEKIAVIAQEESAEGLIAELQHLILEYVFWPHSSLSRPLIEHHLLENGIKYKACVFYDTLYREPSPLPNLKEIHEIVFTSPSTIDAFIHFFGEIPEDKVLTTIGPVTRAYLQKLAK